MFNAEVICFIILNLHRQKLFVLEDVLPFSQRRSGTYSITESGPVGIRTRDLLLSSFADANLQGKRSTAGLRAHRMYT